MKSNQSVAFNYNFLSNASNHSRSFDLSGFFFLPSPNSAYCACVCVCVRKREFNLSPPSTLLALFSFQTLTTASPIHARTEAPASMRSTPLSAFVCLAMVEPRVKKVTVTILFSFLFFRGRRVVPLALIKMKVLFLLLLLVEPTLKNEKEASRA